MFSCRVGVETENRESIYFVYFTAEFSKEVKHGLSTRVQKASRKYWIFLLYTEGKGALHVPENYEFIKSLLT